MEKQTSEQQVSVTKVRIGVALWGLSYLPFPLLILHILHAHGMLQSAASTSSFLAIAWGIQILIGIIGILIAGREAISLLRGQGIRRLPKAFWRLLWRGEIAAQSEATA